MGVGGIEVGGVNVSEIVAATRCVKVAPKLAFKGPLLLRDKCERACVLLFRPRGAYSMPASRLSPTSSILFICLTYVIEPTS